jgi:hypothetical protein
LIGWSEGRLDLNQAPKEDGPLGSRNRRQQHDVWARYDDLDGLAFDHFRHFAALVLYPIGRILRRIGFSPVWSVLTFVPIVNLIGLRVLALSSWPRSDDG